MFNRFYWDFMWNFKVIFGCFGKLILWNLFWYKIDMFNISCVISLLFMTVSVQDSTIRACFRIKLLTFFWKCSFQAHYGMCWKELSFRIIATSPIYVMLKEWIRLLWILHVVVYFSSEEVLQDLSKNNPTKKQIDAEIQMTLKNTPVQKGTEEKMLYRLSPQITKPSYKLTILTSECVFHKFCYLDYHLLLLLQCLNTCLIPK